MNEDCRASHLTMRFSTQCVIAKTWPPGMRGDLEGCGWVVGEVQVHSGEKKEQYAAVK